MESINSALKLKLAWQEAYRLRSCPSDALLFADQPTAEVTRHVQFCPACQDIRNTAPSTRSAWQELSSRLCAGVTPHRATEVTPSEGQVWALREDLAHWGSDGNYYRPPRVLLLGSDGNALTVAQTYYDTTLAADGDVVLAESSFGFAQAWNIYTIHRDMLCHCLGGVKREEVQEVLKEAGKSRAEIDENSILYWFRTTEVMVGAEIAMSAVAQLLAEMEAASLATVNSWLEKLLGSFSDVFNKLKHYEQPEPADSLSDLLFGVRSGSVAPVLSMASGDVLLQINVVRKNTNDDIVIKTITAAITDDSWQNGTYFIAGKLEDEFPVGLHLLAWLTDGHVKIGECVNQIAENSPYFDIVFHDVPEEASRLENLKLILVSP